VDEVDEQLVAGHDLGAPEMLVRDKDRPHVQRLTDGGASAREVAVHDQRGHGGSVTPLRDPVPSGPVVGIVDDEPAVEGGVIGKGHAVQ
jgi:hypothetical protein